MINKTFEYMSYLQYKVKSLARRVEAFESGEKYAKMAAEHKSALNAKDRIIKALGLKLAEANARAVTIRNYWAQIMEDLEKEHEKELRGKDREIKEMEERALRAERRVDELKDERLELKREMYQVKTELEDEREKSARLVAQLKRGHENSSAPSSQQPNRKKIANSREETGKKPGGQPGHEGHRRKWREPTSIVEIPPPADIADNPEYYPTGKIIAKQLVNVEVRAIVVEYRTPEYRHRPTRCTAHADFPDGVVDDVNYGGTVKAFAFLLNNHANVSVDKTRAFLSDVTGGALEISNGMINGLSKEFSTKTKEERADAFSSLLRAPVMGADFTSVRVNGELRQVLVCAAENALMYYARERKGHEGVKDTPVEHYSGTLVHDHEKTFYSYGRWHQECLAHILRYLIASMEYELNLTWSRQMRELIREMIHCRNSLGDGEDMDKDAAAAFEGRYLAILETAKSEYEYEPPSKYYKDGYNLYRRMLEYKGSHLLFLHDKDVPTDNNLCERLLRVLKRKARQVMTFRSFDSLGYLCTSLGILAQLKAGDGNLYAGVVTIFE